MSYREFKTFKNATSVDLPSSNLVFHYTTQEGLIGIVNQQELWATDIMFMNDSSEFKLAFTIAQDRLNHFSKKPEFFADQLQFIKDALTEFDFGIPFEYAVFVACFSSVSDDLGQWRAYSGKRTGYEIAFNASKLKGFKLINWETYFAPCRYKPNEHIALIDECIQFHLMHSAGNSTPIVFFRDLASIAPLIKDRAFRSEREWRLVCIEHSYASMVDLKNLGCSSGVSTVKPFLPLPLSKIGSSLGIEKIRVGPTPDPILAKQGVARLLQKHQIPCVFDPVKNKPLALQVGTTKLDTVFIFHSTIPFKNW